DLHSFPTRRSSDLSIFVATYNRTCVTHCSTFRSSLTCDETNNRLSRTAGFVPSCSFSFKVTANFTDHHHRFSFRVVNEKFQSFSCSCSNDWVTSDTNRSRNTVTGFHHLVSSLVSKGS